MYSDINETGSVVAVLDIVFLVAGIIFAVFAALLLYSFISVSITDKKKEIGILRALGAKGGDVFKIFFAESGIIAAVCLAASVILTAVLAGVFNSVLYSLYGILVTVVVYTPVSILMMLAIAATVAFPGTFIPVRITAGKKPADAIREL
ncbi:MAG: FtsX-like permease family protein [Clostridia bacterium]|nr:FtsX-like permease family protein [Clostridia bacterium]